MLPGCEHLWTSCFRLYRLTSSLSAFKPSAYTHPHILSMSSQSVTTPCSIGYLIFSSPLNSCARLPMNKLSCIAPAMTRGCFGRPTLQT